jgi:repressor LexA
MSTVMKKDLTPRQQEILEFISQFVEENGYPPTYREIGSKFEIASTFGVKRHLDALKKKGYLNIESSSSRTLSLTTEIRDNKAIDTSIEIPIVGRVAAGYPILAEQNIEGTLSLDITLIGKKNNCFALRVKGDSMINAGIFEGDLVIVTQQNEAKNGDIVVAMLGDEATLKRFEKNQAIVKLIPENDNYQPIIVNNSSDFSIIGKVAGVMRWYN